MDLHERIYSVLSEFDNKTEGFRENEVSKALSSIIENDAEKEDPFLMSEGMAFSFWEDNTRDTLDWGTYFGPEMIYNDGEGHVYVTPAIQKVTPDVIKYYAERIEQAKNPILKARYAGLVWDFSEKICKEKPHFKIAKTYINNLLLIAERKDNQHPTEVITKLKRALEVSISINDLDAINRTKKVIIEFEKKVAQDNMPGLWGFSYDLLVENEKVEISVEEEQSIISELELILSRTASFDFENEKYSDPWPCECAGIRLAKYYRKKNKTEDIRRVLNLVSKAYLEGRKYTTALQKSGALETVYGLYKRFNLHHEENNILKELNETGKQLVDELKPISQEISIPKEKLDQFWNQILSGDLNDSIRKLISSFMPNQSEVKQDLVRLAKEFPLLYLITTSLQDKRGRILAKVNSIERDMVGHQIKKTSEYLYTSTFLLRIAYEKLIKEKNLNTESSLQFLAQSDAISSERHPIIKRGLDAFFSQDYIVAAHILIPCIEDILREVLEQAGGLVLKKGKYDGFNLISLDSMLEDHLLERILTDDLCFYFRTLLTDPRGWNLRNEVCHGLLFETIFHPQYADRVFHALLCLGLLRKSPE